MNNINNKISNNNGAMLMNVLVAMSIMVVLASITIPYLRNFQPAIKLSGAAEDLSSDLRLAQQLTITEQVVHAVDIDQANDLYRVLRIDVATTTLKTVALPAVIQFYSVNGFTNDLVKFNSYGAVSESGDITLENTSSSTKVIYVRPSGYIQVN